MVYLYAIIIKWSRGVNVDKTTKKISYEQTEEACVTDRGTETQLTLHTCIMSDVGKKFDFQRFSKFGMADEGL